MRKKTCPGFGSVDVMLQVLYKSKGWGRNQLPLDLQDTRNISQRNKFSLYLYTAWPHFSRISWIHKLGSSSLSPDLYRFSLVALSFCEHAVLDWPSSLLCHSGAVFQLLPFLSIQVANIVRKRTTQAPTTCPSSSQAQTLFPFSSLLHPQNFPTEDIIWAVLCHFISFVN